MFQVTIFFRLLSYFRLIMSLIVPFFPAIGGDDDLPSDNGPEFFKNKN